MGFQQAAIKIEREKEFEELKAAGVHVFARDTVEKLLKRVRAAGLRIRDFEPILEAGIFERVDKGFGKSATGTKQLYEALTVSDRAQMREFYLSKVEDVDPALRAKYQKIYRYY
jgi:hypothetical protein